MPFGPHLHRQTGRQAPGTGRLSVPALPGCLGGTGRRRRPPGASASRGWLSAYRPQVCQVQVMACQWAGPELGGSSKQQRRAYLPRYGYLYVDRVDTRKEGPASPCQAERQAVYSVCPIDSSANQPCAPRASCLAPCLCPPGLPPCPPKSCWTGVVPCFVIRRLPVSLQAFSFCPFHSDARADRRL